MKTIEQIKSEYEAALKDLRSAETAFDGSPASIAWVNKASKRLTDAQLELIKATNAELAFRREIIENQK